MVSIYNIKAALLSVFQKIRPNYLFGTAKESRVLDKSNGI